MRYKVTKQYGRGPETAFAEFDDVNDARMFIENKLSSDVAMNIKVIYRLVNMGEVIETFDSSGASDQGSQGSSGKGSGASFSPTPLNTAPRPSGTPQKWMVDKDEDEKKK